MGRALQSSRGGPSLPALPELSRRQLLRVMGAATSAWTIAACGVSAHPALSDGTSPGAVPVTSDTADADVALVVAAIADEEALADLYRLATRTQPSLAGRLTPQLRLQREHIKALRDALSEPAPEPTGATPAVPRGAPAALAAVVQRTMRATHQRHDDCLAAESGLLARLMGSIAASHAVSVESIAAEP